LLRNTNEENKPLCSSKLLPSLLFQIGSVLRGIVNKLGEQHIGCLVHNCFNASISKPVDVEMSDWEGFKLDLGEKFFFQVTDVSGQNGLIFIRGTLPEGR